MESCVGSAHMFSYDLKTEFIALHTFMGFQYFLQFGANF